jgi:nucleoside-diphosphate-sugar epimerase
MKILVTGSAGFFGSWLMPAIEEAGHEGVGYDIADGRDIFDGKVLAGAMRGCDAVIHLAAWPHYKPESALPAREFVRLNVIGTAAVVAAMKAARVKRLVYASSGALYGFGPGRSLDGWVTPPITEAKGPTTAEQWVMVDIYGASKLACEAWLPLAIGRDWAVTSLRVNCIEPHHVGAQTEGAHWGWWCGQDLAAKAFIAACERADRGFAIVNVGQSSENLDTTMLDGLLA